MNGRNQIGGQRFAVLGGGKSGIAVSLLLRRQGADVFLSERSHSNEVIKNLQPLLEKGIEVETGGHSIDKLLKADVFVVSPGIPLNIYPIEKARSRGIPIYSELEVASWFCKSKIVAITGTNGKTTATTLLGKILSTAGRKHVVAGNIGLAFSEVADTQTEDSIVVLEVSSFQLELIRDFHPVIAIILNITPDHLDRYESMQDYIKAKMNIIKNLTSDDYFIYNSDDEFLHEYISRMPAACVPVNIKGTLESGIFLENNKTVYRTEKWTEELFETNIINLTGMHNLTNTLAVSAAARLLEISSSSLSRAISQFHGLEHRLETVGTFNDIKVINDSKATNVDAVVKALESLSSPIILLAGGTDKMSDLAPLEKLIYEKVSVLVLLGEAAARMENAWGALPQSVYRAKDFEDAVRFACTTASPGDTVLLSPACSSFDMFENFEERGKVFKMLVISFFTKSYEN